MCSLWLLLWLVLHRFGFGITTVLCCLWGGAQAGHARMMTG
jgi:hypothetical protein